MNRYQHRRMTAEELSQALDRLNLTAGAFMRLTGATRWTVEKWLDPNVGRQDGGDIPHWVAVFLALLALPGAMALAQAITSDRLIFEDGETEKERRP